MFGHIAKHYKSVPVCGHCSETHEMKECNNRNMTPKCRNCKRNQGLNSIDVAHSVLDATKFSV